LASLIAELEVPEVACEVGLCYGVNQLYQLDHINGSVFDGLIAYGYQGGIKFVE
jgi:hypothetical protein